MQQKKFRKYILRKSFIGEKRRVRQSFALITHQFNNKNSEYKIIKCKYERIKISQFIYELIYQED